MLFQAQLCLRASRHTRLVVWTPPASLYTLPSQVLLLYVPSCIQAGMSNEALAASLAYLEAHVCGTGSWWNVWLLALHARIAAKVRWKLFWRAALLAPVVGTLVPRGCV